MYRIICDYCGETNTFADPQNRPETCPNCNSILEHLQAEQVSDALPLAAVPVKEEQTAPERTFVPPGLTLIYQTTGEQIVLEPGERIVLGRATGGKEVLGKIPHISRSHSMIEFKGGQYVVTDMGSTNGTFVGVDKVNCKTNPEQPLVDGGLLFMGQEPFLIKFRPAESPAAAAQADQSMSTTEDSGLPPKPTRYRCRTCGQTFDVRDDICPHCGTYDSMEITH